MSAKDQLRQQWAARIVEYRSSGLTLKSWCAAHDCTVDQMKYWLYKSNRATSVSSTQVAPRFVPVAVKDEDQISSLVLRIGQAQIELHAGFDPKLLREIVRALTEAGALC